MKKTKFRSRALKGKSRRRGFTLIEIMIVILIIGMLMNIAAPAMIHARDSSQERACVANLHNIVMAKEEYAIQNNIGANITPTSDQIGPYLKPGTAPKCPSGVPGEDVYVIGDLNTTPTCPYGGPVGLPHVLQ